MLWPAAAAGSDGPSANHYDDDDDDCEWSLVGKADQGGRDIVADSG